MATHRILLALTLALSPVVMSGCSVYHSWLFARQDQAEAIEEPYLLNAAPADAALVASGSFNGVDKRSGNRGAVSLHRGADGQTYLQVADWALLEAPDLYLYVSSHSYDEVVANKRLLRDDTRSIKLTANNLRPSNIGFEGDSTWFRAPDGLDEATGVYVYCYQFNELFAAAQLKPVAGR